jgi:hypothetical protein
MGGYISTEDFEDFENSLVKRFKKIKTINIKMDNYTSLQLYEIGNSFYFGSYHELNSQSICNLSDAALYYKLAYEKKIKELN